MDIVERLRACLRFDQPEATESELERTARDAANEVERLREWQRQMVEIQASGGRLDGYRELADKLAARDAEIDRLRAENAQAKEAIAVLGAGRPLGDIIGLHTAQNAIAEAKRLRAENAKLLDWGRVVGEETILAGFPGGDRAQTLKNIRTMRRENVELREDWRRLNYLERQMKCFVRDAIDAEIRNLSEPVQKEPAGE
jgi:hypothetical protein